MPNSVSTSRIVLEGSGFSYKGDMIKSGEVDDIIFLNDNGKVLGAATMSTWAANASRPSFSTVASTR